MVLETDMYGVRETCAPMVSETDTCQRQTCAPMVLEKDMYPYGVRDRHVLIQCLRHMFA